MSVTDRKERDLAARRRKILDAAWSLAETEGWSGVSIRKLAEIIEYGPTVLYQHFTNKDEILRELREEAFDELIEALAEAWGKAAPRHEIQSLAQAYLDFGIHRKVRYEVMMELGGVIFSEKHPTAKAAQLMQEVESAIKAWCLSEGLKVEHLTMEWFELCLYLHGLVAARSISFIQDSEQTLKALFQFGVNDLMNAWRLRFAK